MWEQTGVRGDAEQAGKQAQQTPAFMSISSTIRTSGHIHTHTFRHKLTPSSTFHNVFIEEQQSTKIWSFVSFYFVSNTFFLAFSSPSVSINVGWLKPSVADMRKSLLTCRLCVCVSLCQRGVAAEPWLSFFPPLIEKRKRKKRTLSISTEAFAFDLQKLVVELPQRSYFNFSPLRELITAPASAINMAKIKKLPS